MVWYTIHLATSVLSVLINNISILDRTIFNDMFESIMLIKTKMILFFDKFLLNDQ